VGSPKILILTPGLGRGGAQKVFKEQTLFYSGHFNTTGCVFNWDGALVEEKNFVVQSLDVPAGDNWISKFYFFCQRVNRVRAIKQRNNIDISISHLEGADYVNILSRRGEKVICYIHGTKFHDGEIRGFLGWVRRNVFMPYLYRQADRIIPVSKGIKEEFEEKLKIFPKKITVITNGFDLEKIEMQSQEAISAVYLGLFRNYKTICLCSRLAPQKNQEIFLSVFADVQKSMPCKLIILGDGELRSSLINQSKQMGLRVFPVWENIPFSEDFDVYFLGNVANPFPYISQSSVFALPSSWEGFPLALCEAMVCGVPVVASDCPTGPREILSDETGESIYGFLLPIPVKDDDLILKWKNTLLTILRDESIASEYGSKAKRRSKDFSAEKMKAAWMQLVMST
jgi:glycosyltransferase involved in cell wall biosynthesis